MKSARALLLCPGLAALLLAAPARGQDKDKDKAKDKDPTKEATTDYYPLPEGTTWTYKPNEKKFTVRVAGFDKVGDQRCARLETRDLPSGNEKTGKLLASEHVAVTSEGVFRYQFE